MDIMDVLDENIMCADMKMETKEQAIDELTQLLYKHKYIDDIDSFKNDIYYRESLGKTGIGNYIAIPHGQSSSVCKNGIAIGKFKKEIPWESLDGKGVKVVCLFSVQAGENGGNEHLKLLALIAGKLGNDIAVDQLLKAKTVAEMKKAFR